MATSPDMLRFFLDQVAGEMDLATRRMFGEYCLYAHGKVIGFLCDDSLFLKTCPALLGSYPELELAPPYPNAKLHFHLAPDAWENRANLISLLRHVAAALPPAKPKSPRLPRKS